MYKKYSILYNSLLDILIRYNKKIYIHLDFSGLYNGLCLSFFTILIKIFIKLLILILCEDDTHDKRHICYFMEPNYT